MAEVGPDTEVFELAISREVEAYYFFLTLANRVKSPKMRKVFEELAEEELGHKEKLELEIMKLGKTVDEQLKPPRPESDYILADTPSQLDMDYKDILLLGIEKEKASFRTYINLLSTIQDEETREILLAIAEEEVKHKLRFEEEYNKLISREA